jgi:hypothetical protein
MGLEGFLKNVKKPIEKKKTTPKKDLLEVETVVIDSNHHFLKCNNVKCKFERRLRKKILDESDLICDKCKGIMKEYVPRKKTKKSQEDEIENEEETESL